MPHEVYQNKAVYAKTPAWHGIGTVLEDTFTAEDAIAILNPEKEPVRKWQAAAVNPVTGEVHLTDAFNAIVQLEDGKVKIYDFSSPEYGLVQLEDQLRWMDEIVRNTGGSHYEAAVRLRGGAQTILTLQIGEHVLDPNGRADKSYTKLFGANSWNRSWALMAKKTNIRAECANMAAMVMGQMSPEIRIRHTTNIMDRVAVAQQALGLIVEHDKLFYEVAEALIEAPMHDNQFQRILDTIFAVEDSGTGEKDEEAIGQVRGIYELNPSQMRLHGTMWGGFNAVTYFNDWNTKVRGGKTTTVGESRFLRQLDDTKGLKQKAWEVFREVAEV